jgi:uncharacterized membrane protein YidH (DUF202 family)
MYASQMPNQPLKPSNSWLSILQLVLSALAAVLLLGAAIAIVFVILAQYFIQGSTDSDPTQSFMIAASLAFAGSLAIPSAWYAWKHITHPEYEPEPRPEPRGFVIILTIVIVILVGGALVLGNWVSTNPSISWFLLPILNIIATGLPAFWLVYIGTRGLIPGKPSRKWGVFTSGLLLSPLIILVLEFLVLVGMGILALLWVMFDSSLANQLNSLVFRLQNAAANPEALLRIALPFFLNPVILFMVFAYISVIVPMIEEALKPIGVWLMAGLKITPAQGFGYGVLCGAGFGLFENLGNTSSGGETWMLLASARISTLLLHCLTTGLVGWALASAWSQKRYLRLGITYIFAVLIHGLWNGMAVLSFISSLEGQTSIPVPANFVQFGSLAAIGIVALGAFNLVFYIGFNATLRSSLRENTPPTSMGLNKADELSHPTTTADSIPSIMPGEDKPRPEIYHGEMD